MTSIKKVPKKIRTYIKNILESQEKSSAYSTWLDNYTKAADIKINDMPEDVPYNVSLDGVTATTDDTTSDDSSATDDSTTSDDSATTDTTTTDDSSDSASE